jgi:hypothetical protein
MAKDFNAALSTAIRSLSRTDIEKTVDAAIAAGNTKAEHRDHYLGKFPSLLGALRVIASLVAKGALPTSPETENWQPKLAALPDQLRSVRKGKASASLISVLNTDIEVFVIALKERHLDSAISEFEAAVQRVRELEALATVASSHAAKAATSATESKGKAIAAAGESAGAVGRLALTERRVARRELKIVGIETSAGAHLKRVNDIEAEAASSKRTVSAIQKQLDELANSITTHVGDMRDMQGRITRAIAFSEREKGNYLSRLKGIEQKANEVLLRATAAGLFEVFADRRDAIASKVKRLERSILMSGVAAFIAAVFVWSFAAYNNMTIQDQILLKVGVLSPFIYLIWFFTTQFNKERWLEEEYANRTNMSVSYPGFRAELVALTEGTEFVGSAVEASIDMTQRIFTDPLDVLKPPRRLSRRLKEEAANPSEEPEDAMPELTRKLGGFFESITGLIDKTQKLIQPGKVDP